MENKGKDYYRDRALTNRDIERYKSAAHSVYTGIRWKLQNGWNGATPGQLRAGIDSAKVEQQALAQLLIGKGLFTLEEYEEAMADAMEREQVRISAELSREFGGNVHLV